MTTKATRDVLDLAVRPVLSVVIQGGTIDGTTIGQNVPAPGYFTNLTANSITLTEGGTVTGLNAYYADLAEYYRADETYAVGTVVKIGGEFEITATTESFDFDVFGVISTKPAFLLNCSTESREGIWLPIAMIGRVPCRVIGAVRKGQRLASSDIPGVAEAMEVSNDGFLTRGDQGDRWAREHRKGVPGWTQFFARALVDDDREEERLIEVALVTIK